VSNHVATWWSCRREARADRATFHVKHAPLTAPSAPEVARRVFSAALPQVEKYADILARHGTVRGLIGPREVPRLWERHLLNCGMVTDLVPEGATVCDIGSGAGLPGLVMALRRPDLRVTLVEPLLRRTSFLEEVVAELGLVNVSVRRDRAEALHGTESFDVVTSRAVAPLDRLAGWSLPLVRSGGLFLAMKGSTVQAELDSAADAISTGRGVVDGVVELGQDILEPPVRVVRIVKE
jgi:16S rRNA (guanine527-N7)-methyltransferase